MNIPTKKPWKLTQKEFTNLIGDKFKTTDLAWLVDEGRITVAQYDGFIEALKIPVKYIVQDIEYAVRAKKPKGAEVHKGMIRKALTEGKKVPFKVLKDYPDLQKKQYRRKIK